MTEYTVNYPHPLSIIREQGRDPVPLYSAEQIKGILAAHTRGREAYVRRLETLLLKIESTGALTEGFESGSLHRELCAEYRKVLPLFHTQEVGA